MQNMDGDPVYMPAARIQARDLAIYQVRMTGIPQVVLQVNADYPGAGYEVAPLITQGDAFRVVDLVQRDETVIDLTVLRGLDRVIRP